MSTIFAPPAPPTEAQRRRLYHLNSPKPSGYGAETHWSEGSESKHGVFKPVANIVSLRPRSVETVGKFLPRLHRDSSLPEDSGSRDEEDESSSVLGFGGMPSVVGYGSTNSLFPVLPTFDNSPKYGQRWASDQNQHNISKSASVWRDLLPASEPVPSPPQRGKASASPKSSKQPPVPRRHVSVPRIHLNFDIEEMNSSIDDAIGSAHPRLFRPKLKEEPDQDHSLRIEPKAIPTVIPTALKQRTSTLAGKKRGRPASFDAPKESKAFACDGCRISKTKCQGGFPCSRCERLGKQCTRSTRGRKENEDKIDCDEEDVTDVQNQPEHKQPDHKPCYRNSWCIRPYRHPGHCRHIKMKSRARSKKQRI